MNKVKLVGRLTRDAELNERSEKKVCDMRIAVNGPGNTPPLFIDVVAFGEQAESSAELKKGVQVEVKGSLRYSEWTAEGFRARRQKRSKHSVIVRELVRRLAASAEIDHQSPAPQGAGLFLWCPLGAARWRLRDMPGGKRSDQISARDLEVLEFIARFGVVPRAAVATWAGTGTHA